MQLFFHTSWVTARVCQSQITKFIYQANLDEIGTADILSCENATLESRDRELLLRSLSARVNGSHVQIANKTSDIYIHCKQSLHQD